MACAIFTLVGVLSPSVLTPRADALMLRRGLGSLEEAANLYSRALEAEQDNLDLKLKLADALNGVMRVKVHAPRLGVALDAHALQRPVGRLARMAVLR